ncbi:hypothetical protein P3T75_03255 [Enterococcus montenegrensis]|uniref:hypothetical protein n=1 Tax=Enterococcus montenegrensis TaxID=3031993 RepID=UPI00249E4016|nr:hypothetical protein [Enterococcus montenegrensis]WHA09870.1 hypothetical protein P3T75_03255 [Enterococcus montenegrensis]
MQISKLNLLFTKKFLSDITIYNVEMFDLNGKNYFTNELDSTISKALIPDIVELQQNVYLPIEIQKEISFILRFKKIRKMIVCSIKILLAL